MQSPRQDGPRHVAIIMDGNGRWAERRGRPRSAGHLAGARAVRRAVEAARRLAIPILTLFAFSSDNWHRPPEEVDGLLRLFERFLRAESVRCAAQGVRLRVIGRRDRLCRPLLEAIGAAELATRRAEGLLLRIAIDYSGRDALVRAAGRSPAPRTRKQFARALAQASHAGDSAPDVDLLIRTGGELRLSDFLLWESAYAELVFCPRLWPDFAAGDLVAAVEEFHRRDRRFGRIAGPHRKAVNSLPSIRSPDYS
jgi:undecaprenyl diphosphate synthase